MDVMKSTTSVDNEANVVSRKRRSIGRNPSEVSSPIRENDCHQATADDRDQAFHPSDASNCWALEVHPSNSYWHGTPCTCPRRIVFLGAGQGSDRIVSPTRCRRPKSGEPASPVRSWSRRPLSRDCHRDIAATIQQKSRGRCFQSDSLPACGLHGPLRCTSVSQAKQASRLSLSHSPSQRPLADCRIQARDHAARHSFLLRLRRRQDHYLAIGAARRRIAPGRESR